MTNSNFKITLDFLQRQKDVILLDNSTKNKSTKNNSSFLFLNPISKIIAFTEKEFLEALIEIDRLSEKYYLAGYIAYEAGHFFTEKTHRPKNLKTAKKQPLLFFGVYQEAIKCEIANEKHLYPPYIKQTAGITKKTYISKINQIKKEIEAGNTYQVNYTFNQKIAALCDPTYLYFFLREEQGTCFGAYIKNQYTTSLCFSPELFFMRNKEKIITRPMKGTTARGKTKAQDKQNLLDLKTCEKNNAENLMIVDLIRNDLSRVAKPNSILVKNLFKTETHKTLHQMTSTIEASLKPTTTYKQIFKALFPCGSITGTPKIKTMSIINDLENHKRDIYCGAIGYITPSKKCVFNIPIRTLQKPAKAKIFDYKVGSGIVWDSSPEAEYQECLLKTSFISRQKTPDFEIIETMLLTENKITFENKHLARMEKSAAFFGFPFPKKEIKNLLKTLKTNKETAMLRILLAKNQTISYQKIAISPLNEKENYITIAKTPLDAKNIFLKHKTTYRPWYKNSMDKIKKGLIWDELFLNYQGYLTEGARSNIFIEKNGVLYTPKLECGLLNGLLRTDLLLKNKCFEKNLTILDLQTSDKIYCGNSVRGLVPVVLK